MCTCVHPHPAPAPVLRSTHTQHCVPTTITRCTHHGPVPARPGLDLGLVSSSALATGLSQAVYHTVACTCSDFYYLWEGSFSNSPQMSSLTPTLTSALSINPSRKQKRKKERKKDKKLPSIQSSDTHVPDGILNAANRYVCLSVCLKNG